MWAFVLTISFPFITVLNEAEESRNVLLPVMKLFREFQVIDIFYQQASIVLLTHLLFSTLILPVVIYKNL